MVSYEIEELNIAPNSAILEALVIQILELLHIVFQDVVQRQWRRIETLEEPNHQLQFHGSKKKIKSVESCHKELSWSTLQCFDRDTAGSLVDSIFAENAAHWPGLGVADLKEIHAKLDF